MKRTLNDRSDLQGRSDDYVSTVFQTETGKTDHVNDIETPSINLPRGGGAIRGIDEKCQVNSVFGTLSLGITIPSSPSRHGFIPALGLNYDSGSGNSPFGLGWDLSTPSVTRRTEKMLPRYRDDDESDTFVLTGSEDLVPFLINDAGIWKRSVKQRTENGITYIVTRYRPRIEHSFLVIERWTRSDGDTHWRTISPNNIHSYYGVTPESRVSDPNDPARVFEWKLSSTHDDKGNICTYQFKKEDFAGIPKKLSEKNRRDKCTQTYLKSVRYGNRRPYYLGDALPAADDFHFNVVFDYGEHDPAERAPKDVDLEKNAWTCRDDPFSVYRSGFDIRTYRRCRRILVFHCFDEPDLAHSPYLVRSLELEYRDGLELTGARKNVGGFSYLAAARQCGHIWDPTAGTYTKRSLPETEFEYQPHVWDTSVHSLSTESLANAPIGIDDRRYLWVDLFGEGIAGILTEDRGSGSWFYKYNLGRGVFSRAVEVASRPNLKGLADGRLALLELEGNGVKYLVNHSAEPRGSFKLSDSEEWEPFKAFESYPNPDIADPSARLFDVTGDGAPDLVCTDEDRIRVYKGHGEKGFVLSETLAREIDEEKGPAIVFADRTQSVFLADMNGDGLTDIVRIRNGDIHYWPNLGFGRFGGKVAMDGSPVFDHPDAFDPANIRLADIDSSGTTDIVYLGRGDFRVWLNQSGNAWSAEPETIGTLIDTGDLSEVTVTDLLGTGTACIVRSTRLPEQEGYAVQYIDLMGSRKPHLLTCYINNCGKEVAFEYRSSTQFYLDDKAAGRKWITKLPFPVHCVSRVTSRDRIRDTLFTSSYRYSHGYFDHEEREFRGFARVEQLDTEDFSSFRLNDAKNVVEEELHQPPVRTVSWFHTGVYLNRETILHNCEEEYFQNAGFDEYEFPQALIRDDLSAKELREACRALKGLPLRTEVYADDDSPVSRVPFSATQSNVEIRRIQPNRANRYAVFQVVPSESISYAYERNASDPRISHTFALEVDELGNTKNLRRSSIRAPPDPKGLVRSRIRSGTSRTGSISYTPKPIIQTM